MKERFGISKEKLMSVEEGLKPAEPVTGGNICRCDRFILYTKLVLYIELILFLGWSSYTLWQVYNQQTEIKLFNAFHSNGVEYSTVPTEVLKSLPLEDGKNTLDTIQIRKNDPLEEDVIPSEIPQTNDQLNIQSTIRDLRFDDNFIWDRFETTTANIRLEDSLESSSNDEDKEIIVKIPRLDASESKEKEDSAVMEIEFPFLWQIHQEISPFKDDSSEAVEESIFGGAWDYDVYQSNEKDESNDVLEFRQTSTEKETEQRNEEEESNFNSKEVPTSTEILLNFLKVLKSMGTARKDLDLESLRADDFLENLENSKSDETFDPWKSATSVESSSTNEEESLVTPTFFLLATPSKFASSEEDVATSESKSDSSDEQFVTTPAIDSMNDSTDNTYTTEAVTVTTEENDSSVPFGTLDSFSNFPNNSTTALKTENADSEASSATTHEYDYDSIMYRDWEPMDWDNYEDFEDLDESDEVEKVDSEQKYVLFGPSDLNERDSSLCVTQLNNEFKVIRCSDMLDASESKSVSTTEDHDTSFEKKLFDENSDNISDELDGETIQMSSSSEDSSVIAITPKFKIWDTGISGIPFSGWYPYK